MVFVRSLEVLEVFGMSLLKVFSKLRVSGVTNVFPFTTLARKAPADIAK